MGSERTQIPFCFFFGSITLEKHKKFETKNFVGKDMKKKALILW